MFSWLPYWAKRRHWRSFELAMTLRQTFRRRLAGFSFSSWSVNLVCGRAHPYALMNVDTNNCFIGEFNRVCTINVKYECERISEKSTWCAIWIKSRDFATQNFFGGCKVADEGRKRCSLFSWPQIWQFKNTLEPLWVRSRLCDATSISVMVFERWNKTFMDASGLKKIHLDVR